MGEILDYNSVDNITIGSTWKQTWIYCTWAWTWTWVYCTQFTILGFLKILVWKSFSIHFFIFFPLSLFLSMCSGFPPFLFIFSPFQILICVFLLVPLISIFFSFSFVPSPSSWYYPPLSPLPRFLILILFHLCCCSIQGVSLNSSKSEERARRMLGGCHHRHKLWCQQKQLLS